MQGVGTDQPMPSQVKPGLILYVATTGCDDWSGTRATAGRNDGPFATLERARDAIRAMKRQGGLPPGGVRVVIAPGVYYREAAFTLTAEDSGTPDAPVVYAGPARGTAVFSGGRTINSLSPVTDPAVLQRFDPAVRGRVLQCDLAAQGITDFGEIISRGHGRTGDHMVGPLELFFRGQPMQVSRWPNAGVWANDGWLVNTTGTRQDYLGYEGDRPSRWVSDEGIWAHGFWGSEWHYTTEPVARIDREQRHIFFPSHLPIGGSDRFYLVNILEELDTPGEYYLDRATGVLYFLPPTTIRQGDAVVSMLRQPALELTDVEHVTFERIAIEHTRAAGVRISGGRGVTLAGCTFRNIGTDGVRLLQGFDHRIISCDFLRTGDCGVYVEAGDRANLIPANHTIQNCHFDGVCRQGQAYHGAIGVAYGGVMGLRITHNLIHDLNHTAIFFFGNDIVMEHNELYNCVLQGDDAGAVYTGRDWTFQGNVFRHNYLHHNGSSGRHPIYGSMGLYHDDAAGGTQVEGNIFEYVSKAVFTGGGVNTQVENNIFVHCAPAYWIDERGVSEPITGFMKERFDVVHADAPRWVERYPGFRVVQDAYRNGTGIPPVGNSFVRNIVYDSPRKWMISPWATIPAYLPFHDNLIDEDPRFVDPRWGDYRLRPDSPALRLGVQAIPVEQIGLVKDAYRTKIERVESRLELVAPITLQPDGTAHGTVRLYLRNRGDTTVADVEYVGAKCLVSAEVAGYYNSPVADAARVEHGNPWRFKLAPSGEAARDFAITVAAGAVNQFEVLEINSRGRRARPARLRTTVTASLTAVLEVVKPLCDIHGVGPARMRVTVRNQGDQTVSDTIKFSLVPADVATAEPVAMPIHLKPGEKVMHDIALALSPNAPASRPYVLLHAEGDSLLETSVKLPVERTIRRLKATPLLAEMANALAAEPVHQVCLDWTGQTGSMAEVRFALAGDALLLAGRIDDPKLQVTDPLWQSSHLELFGAQAPGAERLGQVFLVPAHDDLPAQGYLIQGAETRLDTRIRLYTAPIEGGYTMAAIVPLALLTIDPASDHLALDLAVTTSDAHGVMGGRRGTLFGSPRAFTENEHYAVFSIR